MKCRPDKPWVEPQFGYNHVIAFRVLCGFTDGDSLASEFEEIVFSDSEALAVDEVKKSIDCPFKVVQVAEAGLAAARS